MSVALEAVLAKAGLRVNATEFLSLVEDAARRLGEFLLGPLSTADGRLHRTWREGVAKGTGYLEDYADVAHGLYKLHVATGELRDLHDLSDTREYRYTRHLPAVP